MPSKLPVAQRLKRSMFQTDEEFLAALEQAGRHKEAESYRVRKGL